MAVGLLSAAVTAQTSPFDATIATVRSSDGFKKAMAVLDRDHDRLVAEIITLTEIPAPPFKETARAAAYLEMLRASGLTDLEQDEEGNVMGLRRGAGAGRDTAPLIAIAAHLDTVFPEGTDVKVKRDGDRLSAPGIGDDTRSLAVLLAMIRAMNEAGIRTESDLLFIGNVGEEGQGDLRGVKYLFNKGKYKDRIKMFISVDGAGGGANITHGGVGSRRYRVIFKGPGGHSYGAFGLVSPAFAMAGAMQRFGKLTVPEKPKTTYSVGVVGGGTSVNSIPFESWMELDMRSESRAELQKLDESLMALIADAVREENAARSTAQGPVTAELKLIGDRPSGETPIDSPIVQTAAASIRAAGGRPTFSWSSTDSNIPISLGIPAITVDSGGRGGRAHALDEWIAVDKVPSLRGIEIALATILALAR
ncbi:MAG: M20/M25/M40 family metallo-hydrolase [Acidobacteria bacterium]|nr:M20/M25/M40 family metallo-hydrolase [Acidobacteriota bacterium]